MILHSDTKPLVSFLLEGPEDGFFCLITMTEEALRGTVQAMEMLKGVASSHQFSGLEGLHYSIDVGDGGFSIRWLSAIPKEIGDTLNATDRDFEEDAVDGTPEEHEASEIRCRYHPISISDKNLFVWGYDKWAEGGGSNSTSGLEYDDLKAILDMDQETAMLLAAEADRYDVAAQWATTFLKRGQGVAS